MKKLFTLILFVGLISNLNAQTYKAIYYPEVGSVYQIDSKGNVYGIKDTILIKKNSKGEPVFDLPLDSHLNILNVFLDENENIYLSAFFLGTIQVRGKVFYSSNIDYCVIKLNEYGVFEWCKQIKNTNLQYETAISCQNGIISVSGFFQDSLIVDGFKIKADSLSSGLYYLQLKTDGSILKLSPLRLTSHQYYASVSPLGIFSRKDHSFVVLLEFSGKLDLDTNQEAYDATLMVNYNSNGNIKWSKIIENDHYTNVYNAKMNKNDEVIFSMSQCGGNHGPCETSLLKVDQQGNLINLYTFDQTVYPMSWNLDEDENILQVGEKQYTYHDTASASVVVMNINSGGGVTNSHEFRCTNKYDNTGGVLITSDNQGGYYLLGEQGHGSLIVGNDTLINTSSQTKKILLKYNPGKVMGIVKSSFNNFSLFPNPTKDRITVVTEALIKKTEVFSILGECLYQRETESKETNLDLSSFKNGIYFVQLTTETGKIIKKIVKE